MAALLPFLVIDDDADIRFLRKRALERAFPGCVVVEADGCSQAMSKLAAQPSGLSAVLSDHHLRQEDGATCIRELRKRGVRCPIVMVTASDSPAVHAQAYAAGVDKVFSGAESEVIAYLRGVLGAEEGRPAN